MLIDKLKFDEIVYEYDPKGITEDMLQKIIDKKQQMLAQILEKELKSYQKDLTEKQKQFSEKAFLKWKQNQDIGKSQRFKMNWPADAIMFINNYKKQHENK